MQTGSQIDSCNVVAKETLDLVVATSLPAGRIFNRAVCSILYKEGFMYNSLMTRVPNGHISETFRLFKNYETRIGYCQIFPYETLTISQICKGTNQLLYQYRCLHSQRNGSKEVIDVLWCQNKLFFKYQLTSNFF